jgi:cardiolipin synthase
MQYISCASSSRTATPPANPNPDLEASFESFYAKAGMPVLQASTPHVYFTTEAWGKRAVEFVSQAQDYIFISSFLANTHPINEEIFAALERKASQGVRVYLIFDSSSYYTYMPDKKTFRPTPLAAFPKGLVNTAEYNPIQATKLFALGSLLDRDHRKFWIVDGKRLALGGMNLNYYSLSPQGEMHNIDAFVELGGSQVLKPMVESFCRTWNDNSPDRIDPEDFSVEVGDGPTLAEKLWLFDHRPGLPSSMNTLFDSFFTLAKKEIWMVQAYAFPTAELIAKVRMATSRGVRVNLILSTNSFRTVYEDAANYRAVELIDAGARIFVFDAPDKSFLHYKLLLADETVAAFGSPNFNFRTQYLSRELALVTANPTLGAATMENLKTLLAQSRPMSREEALRYRTLKNFLGWVSMTIGG